MIKKLKNFICKIFGIKQCACPEQDEHLELYEETAKQMQEPPPTCFSNVEMRANSLEGAKNSFEGLAKQFEIQLDSLEQYNRQYIVNFEKIVNRGTRKRPEDATQLIINFLRVSLGINITNRDISICHRQDIPSERQRLGRKFIAPIYCKINPFKLHVGSGTASVLNILF